MTLSEAQAIHDGRLPAPVTKVRSTDIPYTDINRGGAWDVKDYLGELWLAVNALLDAPKRLAGQRWNDCDEVVRARNSFRLSALALKAIEAIEERDIDRLVRLEPKLKIAAERVQITIPKTEEPKPAAEPKVRSQTIHDRVREYLCSRNKSKTKSCAPTEPSPGSGYGDRTPESQHTPLKPDTEWCASACQGRPT